MRTIQTPAAPIGPGLVQTPVKKNSQPLLSMGLLLFSLLLIVGFADFRGDYAYFWGKPFYSLLPVLGDYTTRFYAVLVGCLALIGIFNLLRRQSAFRASPGVQLFFVFLLMSTSWGVAVGFLNGVSPKFIFGDARNLLVYLGIFAISSVATNSDRGLRYLRNLFFVACGLILLKLALSLGSDLILGNPLSWRYMYKSSFLLVPMMVLALAMSISHGRSAVRSKYILLFAIVTVGLLLTQLRGLFIGAFIGMVVIFWLPAARSGSTRSFFAVGLTLFIGITVAFLMQTDVLRLFGFWDYTSGSGLEYRLRQADTLASEFTENWLMGAGLGAFNTSYEWVDDSLSRPYLSEMELLNMLAKLGVIGFGLLAAAFAVLFRECVRMAQLARIPAQRSFILGLAAGMVALFVVALTNTIYASLFFHLYIVIILLALSALREISTAHRQTSSNTAIRRQPWS